MIMQVKCKEFKATLKLNNVICLFESSCRRSSASLIFWTICFKWNGIKMNNE